MFRSTEGSPTSLAALSGDRIALGMAALRAAAAVHTVSRGAAVVPVRVPSGHQGIIQLAPEPWVGAGEPVNPLNRDPQGWCGLADWRATTQQGQQSLSPDIGQARDDLATMPLPVRRLAPFPAGGTPAEVLLGFEIDRTIMTSPTLGVTHPFPSFPGLIAL
ncbi:hypothetical protein ACWGRV_29330 [Streptomyces sp. NPDC055663]